MCRRKDASFGDSISGVHNSITKVLDMYLAWTIVAFGLSSKVPATWVVQCEPWQSLHWSIPKGDVAPKLFERPFAVCSSSHLLHYFA